MEEQCLRCNNRTANGGICRKELKQSAIVTTCSHVLCKECAEKTGFIGTDTKKRQCPVCKQPLPNIDDAAETNLQPTEEYKMSVLCGFDPNMIMECASSALSFWNYQMLQETAYQQHLLLALSKKYSHLNDGVNKLVDDANNQITGLHQRIDDVSRDNQNLQQKNAELADTCRERGKKYSELRKGYEVLKKIVQSNQQGPVNAEVAEQAVRSFVANPMTETLNEAMKGRPENDDVEIAQPTQMRGLYAEDERRSFDLLQQRQGAGNESRYNTNAQKMPPPQRSYNMNRISPDKIPAQHRTPLPGAFRVAAAARSQSSASDKYANYSHAFPAPGSSQRRPFRPSGPNGIEGTRHSTASGYGGITAGMKVGGPSIDSQIRAQSGYVSARNINPHHRNDSLPNPAHYFERP